MNTTNKQQILSHSVYLAWKKLFFFRFHSPVIFDIFNSGRILCMYDVKKIFVFHIFELKFIDKINESMIFFLLVLSLTHDDHHHRNSEIYGSNSVFFSYDFSSRICFVWKFHLASFIIIFWIILQKWFVMASVSYFLFADRILSIIFIAFFLLLVVYSWQKTKKKFNNSDQFCW